MLLNVTEIGSPKVDNGVVSGFSSANYLKITDSFDVSAAQSWEVVYKIKSGTDITTGQSMCGHTGSSNYDPFTIDINSSKFQLGLCKSSSSNLLKDQKGTYTVLVDTTYWLKLTFNGSRYALSYSLDGVDFIEDVVLESTTKIWTSDLVLGRQQGSSSEYPFLGSIDLNECYIKINGELWWTGMVEGGIKPVRSYILKRRETKYYKYNPVAWSPPVLTSDGVLGGDQFAVEASYVSSSNYAYKAMDANDSTFWQCGTNASGHSFTFYSPVPIRVTGLFFTFYDDSKYGIRRGTFYASNDNINWVELKSFTEYTTQWASFDKIGYYKYYKIAILQGGTYNGYVDLKELEIVATQGVEIESTKDDYDIVKTEDSFYSLRRPKVVVLKNWNQPVLSTNDSYDNFSVVNTNIANRNNTDYLPYKAFDYNNSTEWRSANNPDLRNGTSLAGLTMRFGNTPVNITSLEFTNSTTTPISPVGTFDVYGCPSPTSNERVLLMRYDNTTTSSGTSWSVDLSDNKGFYPEYRIVFVTLNTVNNSTNAIAIAEIKITGTYQNISDNPYSLCRRKNNG